MSSELDTGDFGKLVDEYRAIQAPPALLHGVLGNIDTRDTSTRWWLPSAGAFASFAMLAIIAGYLNTDTKQANQPAIAAKSLPNMSSLTSLSLEKPGNVSLSQLNIRSVSVPAMPSAPETTPTSTSTSKQRFDRNHEVRILTQQEKDNVYS